MVRLSACRYKLECRIERKFEGRGAVGLVSVGAAKMDPGEIAEKEKAGGGGGKREREKG